jgi:hypothetical protein
MAQNAFVTWAESSHPWDLETKAVKTLDLPLNLSNNSHGSFYSLLHSARERARLLSLEPRVGK